MARPRLSDKSQNPPSTARESAMSRTALTPIRPIRRRSRAASARMKPSTTGTGESAAAPLGFVLQELTAYQRQCARSQLLHHPGLVGGQEDGGAPDRDILDEIEDLGPHVVVQIPG